MTDNALAYRRSHAWRDALGSIGGAAHLQPPSRPYRHRRPPAHHPGQQPCWDLHTARIRETGLTVYGFGERKTPKPFVAACDKFIYLENPDYPDSPTPPTDAAPAPKQTSLAAQLAADTDVVNHLRNAVEAASGEDGWAYLADVGHIITTQQTGLRPAQLWLR